MAKPLALIASDLHVRNYDRIWARHPTLLGDTSYALQQIAELGIEYANQGLGALLLAGDVLDSKLQRADAIDILGRFLDKFLDGGTAVLYIQGDHEYSQPPFLQAIRPQAQHVHQQTVRLFGKTIYGLDYVPLGEASKYLAQVPPCDVLLTHQKWTDFLGKHLGGDCAFSDIPAGNCKLLVTGDYHIALQQMQGSMRVLSPGSVCMQDLGETATKFVWLLDDELGLTPLMLKTRAYRTVEITCQGDLDATLPELYALVKSCKETLPEQIAAPILRIQYPHDQYDIKRWVDSALGQTCHLFFDPQHTLTDEAKQVAEEQSARRQVVLAGGLPGVIRSYYGQDPVLAEAAIRMVGAADKEEEAKRLFAEFQAQGEEAAA